MLEEKPKNQLEKADSKFLAVNVITFRLFGWNKEAAEKSMKILGLRRQAGDLFEFESFIEEQIKKAKSYAK